MSGIKPEPQTFLTLEDEDGQFAVYLVPGQDTRRIVHALRLERDRDRDRCHRVADGVCHHGHAAFLTDDSCLSATETQDGERPLTAWLIERGQSMGQVPTVWWTGAEPPNAWTEDANRAARFTTREKAEAEIARRSGLPIPSHEPRFGIATEHVFLGRMLYDADYGHATPTPDDRDREVERIATVCYCRMCTLLRDLDHLRAELEPLQSVLNGILSDGPVMDTLDADGPWWTPPDPTGVRLHDALIAASKAVDRAIDAGLRASGGD